MSGVESSVKNNKENNYQTPITLPTISLVTPVENLAGDNRFGALEEIEKKLEEKKTKKKLQEKPKKQQSQSQQQKKKNSKQEIKKTV